MNEIYCLGSQWRSYFDVGPVSSAMCSKTSSPSLRIVFLLSLEQAYSDIQGTELTFKTVRRKVLYSRFAFLCKPNKEPLSSGRISNTLCPKALRSFRPESCSSLRSVAKRPQNTIHYIPFSQQRFELDIKPRKYIYLFIEEASLVVPLTPTLLIYGEEASNKTNYITNCSRVRVISKCSGGTISYSVMSILGF